MPGLSSIGGHFWSVASAAAYTLSPPRPPRSVPWAAFIEDERGRPLTVRGAFSSRPESTRLYILVHGLGGSPESPYMVRAAADIFDAGHSCLRLAVRGVDPDGGDLYHAGLTHDVHAILGLEELDGFEDIFLVGFSLGGHIAMCAASEGLDERVRAVAAVCAPVDLEATVTHIDHPLATVYKNYILKSLLQMHKELAASGRSTAPARRFDSIKSIRDLDAITVTARFGFDSTRHYYRSQSIAWRFDSVDRPLLYIGAEHDPVVPARASKPHLEAAPRRWVEVHWSQRGGHVYFPPDLDLGLSRTPGLNAQMLAWLERHATR